MQIKGAIDLGTNSLRGIIAQCDNNGIIVKVLWEQVFLCRIGKGVDKTGLLDEQTTSETLLALEAIRKAFITNHVSSYRFVATSALRDAKDSATFLSKVTSLGLSMSIISGIEEAQIIAKAIHAYLPNHSHNALFADQGGGSVEFIRCLPKEEFYKSLDIGIVRLKERFFKTIPPNTKELESIKQFIEENLLKELSSFNAPAPEQLIIIGGTATSLAKIMLNLTNADAHNIHGVEIPFAFIESHLHEFQTSSPISLIERYGLDPKRADLILGGTIEILLIMTFFRLNTITISDKGLRYGLLID